MVDIQSKYTTVSKLSQFKNVIRFPSERRLNKIEEENDTVKWTDKEWSVDVSLRVAIKGHSVQQLETTTDDHVTHVQLISKACAEHC